MVIKREAPNYIRLVFSWMLSIVLAVAGHFYASAQDSSVVIK